MAELQNNAVFNNIHIRGKEGQDLIYINGEPLLKWNKNSDSDNKWVINAKFLPGTANIDQSNVVDGVEVSNSNDPADPEGPTPDDIPDSDQVVQSSGTELQVEVEMPRIPRNTSMSFESLSRIATNGYVNDDVRPFPTSHTQEDNMFNTVQLSNIKNYNKDDVLLAVDLLSKDAVTHVVAWYPMKNLKSLNDIFYVPVFNDSGSNSKQIKYQYWSAAKKTMYELECNASEAKWVADGIGSAKKPLKLKMAAEMRVLKEEETAETTEKVMQRVMNSTSVAKTFNLAETVSSIFSFDYSLYEYTQSVETDVLVNNSSILSEGDILIGFNTEDDSIRGIGSPVLVNGIMKINLMLYSNKLAGDVIYFKLYKNTSLTEVIPAKSLTDLNENATFKSDGADFLTGNSTQLIFKIGHVSKTIQVPAAGGWSWFSLNVASNDLSGGNVFKSLIEDNSIDQIKTQSAFAKLVNGKWEGTLSTDGTLNILETNTSVLKKMYKLHLSKTSVYTFDGLPVSQSVVTNLTRGYNWIGYPYTTTKNASNVFGTSLYNIGLIKGQTSFSNVIDGQLQSELTTYPLQGYKVVKPTTGLTELIFPGAITVSDIDQPSANNYAFTSIIDDKTKLPLQNTTLATLINDVNRCGLKVVSPTQAVLQWNTFDAVFNGNVLDWKYQGTSDVSALGKSVTLGFSVGLLRRVDIEIGYILSGNKVTKCNGKIDFLIALADPSGDGSTEVLLSTLGFGPYVFKGDVNEVLPGLDNPSAIPTPPPLINVPSATPTPSPTPTQESGPLLEAEVIEILSSDGNLTGWQFAAEATRLSIVGNVENEEVTLAVLTPSLTGELFAPLLQSNVQEIKLTTHWSMIFNTAVLPDGHKDKGFVFTFDGIVQTLLIPLSNITDILSVIDNVIIKDHQVGPLWGISIDNELNFIYRETLDSEYHPQMVLGPAAPASFITDVEQL
jgi:hypothetical protein